MIETQQTVAVDCGIDQTWDYAKDFARWASILPGYQTCDIIDEDNSRWTLKIGVGAIVRTVKVRVHVEEWAGPGRVDFSFKLEGDPVVGSGSYLAVASDNGRTDMTLRIRVEGSGPMAPMWEAMGAPVLPKFAKGFAEELKARIEEASGVSPAEAAAPSARDSGSIRFIAWIRSVRDALLGRRERRQV